MKKLCFLISLLLCLALVLVACSDDLLEPPGTPEPGTEAETPADNGDPADPGDGTPTTPDDSYKEFEQTVQLNSTTKGIKLLGERAKTSSEQLNVDWIGSGLEFVYESKGGTVTVNVNSSDACYFRVWVDGAAKNNTDGTPYFMMNGVRKLTFDVPAGEHTVRVIRVSEPTLAEVHFICVTFYGTLLEDKVPADSEQYIEFVGGNTATGWGILGSETKPYKNQDGSLAYPYLTAMAGGYDYSITALANEGLLVGNIGMAEAYLKASLRGDAGNYGFSRKANAVVVDLGAEDFAAKDTEGITAEDFAKAYTELLLNIYAKNPGCKLYCLYNATNDSFKTAVLESCARLGGEAAGIYTLELTRAAGEIPTAAEQQAYATALAARLTATKDQAVTQAPALPVGTLTNVGHGNGMEIDYNDPKWFS